MGKTNIGDKKKHAKTFIFFNILGQDEDKTAKMTDTM